MLKIQFFTALFVIFIASIGIILIGYGFEFIGGLYYCSLCLYQRYIYFSTAVLPIIGLMRSQARIFILWLCGFIFILGGVIALYQVGTEFNFLNLPQICKVDQHAETIKELQTQLLYRQPVPCNKAPWELFGISIAGYNVISSLLLSIFSFYVATRKQS
jgi:disulfide bond formation protein DsbB